MKKKISIISCVSIIVSSILPVFATQELSNDTLDQKQDTEVLYNKTATYFVSIPKTIVLGNDKTSTYSVKVSGDIPSDKEVYVSPIDDILHTDNFDFYMLDQNLSNPKDPVVAIVTQNKFYWNFQDVANSVEVTDNEVYATDLTSGNWKGNFNFEINMKQIPSILVSATDENNNNLNASATNIEGEEKEQLLSSLVESGYISTENEVDGLINVESDDFNNIADTTFNVSSLYEDGDKVAILHYNEETSEWEYICTDTVENGQIEGDFTSYSPVAFVKIEDGKFNNIYTIYFNSDGGECNLTEKNVIYSNNYGELPVPTKVGYNFIGWYLNDVQILESSIVELDNNTTLIAKWEAKTFTLTFNANGGSCNTVSMPIIYNSTYGTLPSASRSGYTFLGWYTATSGGTKIANTTICNTESDLTVYAQWKVIQSQPSSTFCGYGVHGGTDSAGNIIAVCSGCGTRVAAIGYMHTK